MMMSTIDNEINAVITDVIHWRRHFHKYPEVSFHEEKTAQFVYDTLKSFGNLEISCPTKTSVVARLVGHLPGKVLALRADMDALAMDEENHFDYVSQNQGVMHACGHDGHTAMLLGTAKVLTQLKDDIKGEIRFVFQHAEEMHPGGAKEIVATGALEGVDEILGLHLMANVPVGKIGITYGPVTANSDRFDLVIKGKGGHASQPEVAIDPIVIGAQVVANLQQIVSRKTNPLEGLVVSVTKFHGGTAYNVIPDSVTLNGSVRSFNQKTRENIPHLIEKIAKGITDAHGASYEFSYRQGYSSVVNDKQLTKKVETIILDIFGKGFLQPLPPMMGGEDFSAYLGKIPGCYIILGSGNKEQGIIYPQHHPRYDIDEKALEYGVKLYVHAALRIPGL